MVVILVDEKAAGPDPRASRAAPDAANNNRERQERSDSRLASLFRAPDARVSGRDVGRLSLDASGA
jgi:hypothetical protein